MSTVDEPDNALLLPKQVSSVSAFRFAVFSLGFSNTCQNNRRLVGEFGDQQIPCLGPEFQMES